jgi:hypothetical protein
MDELINEWMNEWSYISIVSFQDSPDNPNQSFNARLSVVARMWQTDFLVYMPATLNEAYRSNSTLTFGCSELCHDISVGIENKNWLNSLEMYYPISGRRLTLLILQKVLTSSGFHLVSQQMCATRSLVCLKWPGPEANHLSPYSSDVSNARN